MTFVPIPEAIEEIRAGRILIVVDDEDRENEDVEPGHGPLLDGHWSMHGYRVHSSAVSVSHALRCDDGELDRCAKGR